MRVLLCISMLAWMDAATAYLADVYGKQLGIKVHISSGCVTQ